MLTLGGDHSIAMGSISGVARVHPDLCVLWVDAHGDINTPASTASGNMHGQPLSFMCGEAKTVPEPLRWLKPWLVPQRLAYIGLRDVDVPEKEMLQRLDVKAFSMTEVDQLGIDEVMTRILRHFNSIVPDGPLHCSFDVDALDPTLTPATGIVTPPADYIFIHLYISQVLLVLPQQYRYFVEDGGVAPQS